MSEGTFDKTHEIKSILKNFAMQLYLYGCYDEFKGCKLGIYYNQTLGSVYIAEPQQRTVNPLWETVIENKNINNIDIENESQRYVEENIDKFINSLSKVCRRER